MPLTGPTSLFTPVVSGAIATLDTGLWTPVVGELQQIWVTARRNGATDQIPDFLMTAQTHGGTWSWTRTQVTVNGWVLALFEAIAPVGGNTSGKLTFSAQITAGLNPTRWRIAGDRWSGNEQAVPTNHLTDVTQTTSTPSSSAWSGGAPGATSAVMAGIATGVMAPAVVAGSGYTELLEAGDTLTTSLELEYANPSAGSTVSWSGCGATNVIIASEIRPLLVSRTLDLRRAIFKPVSRTLDLRRAVLSPVSCTLDLRRAVLSPISRALDLRRQVNTQATRTLDLRRAVSALVVKTLDLRRAVLAPVSRTLDLRRAVLLSVSRALDLRRAVFALALRQLNLRRQINARVVSHLELQRSSGNLPAYVHRGGGPALKPKKQKPEPEPKLPPVTYTPPAKEPDLRLPPILPFTDAERVFLANRRAAEKVVQHPPEKKLVGLPYFAVIQPRRAAPPPHPMSAMIGALRPRATSAPRPIAMTTHHQHPMAAMIRALKPRARK